MIFDHLVLVVRELGFASRHFERLGFTVRRGGEHPDWGTHNALIGMQDGSYLELLAAKLPVKAATYRLLARTGLLSLATAGKPLFHSRFIRHLAEGEGFAGFALLSGDLEKDLQAARSRGLDLAGPFEGSRRRTDGRQVAWRSAAPETADLPFLIEDVTPRELRVPAGEDARHPNGVEGLISLSIACWDMEQSIELYRRLLGFDPQEIQDSGEGATPRIRFRLKETDLFLLNANKIVAMRKRAAAPQSISLSTGTGFNPLILQFSQKQGYRLLTA